MQRAIADPAVIYDQLRAMEEKIDRLAEERTGAEKPESLPAMFSPRVLSDERRRDLTVIERKKWAVYFSIHGCIRCGKTKRMHSGNGFCTNCRALVQRRLTVILQELREEAER
ncbi:MAG: hypothetical protein HYX73_10855 [Acidobacteria bacterium]|nr:hypothetical protein [Acidobacteriota bacterium]